MSTFNEALCRYLRRPPLEGLRVWADPEYRTAVEQLGNHMRAAASTIERQADTIEHLEWELSIRPRITVLHPTRTREVFHYRRGFGPGDGDAGAPE